MSNNVQHLQVDRLQEVHVVHERELSNLELEQAHQKMQLEKQEAENHLTSCCFRMDRRVLSYMTQAICLAGIMIFSCIQLANEAEPQSLYVSLLSTSIGLLIPSPLNNEKKSN